MATPTRPQRPGGRTARNTAAVRKATLDLIVEAGVAGFTVGEVARRAGVDQSTIHRRWGGRDNLLFDSLLDAVNDAVPVPDTGSLPGDATALLEELATFYGTPLGAVVGELSMAPLHDPGAETIRRTMWRRRIDDVSAVMTRAIERGEIDGEVDPVAATELLLAPLHLRLITLGRPDRCDISGIVTTLVAGLTTG